MCKAQILPQKHTHDRHSCSGKGNFNRINFEDNMSTRIKHLLLNDKLTNSVGSSFGTKGTDKHACLKK